MSGRLADIVGREVEVPLLDGSSQRYVNLDNAASTPVLQSVNDGLQRFSQWYASIHRGSGFKSQVSTRAYEQAKALLDEDVLLTTLMEHHSNDLPWRRRVAVERLAVNGLGCIDLEQLEGKLRQFNGRIKIVAITGASNVTGVINPINLIARMAHTYGAEIFVDAAQLAPHRQICMGNRQDEDAIDYLAISAHKMYAPYGTGALIGWPGIFMTGDPDYTGGGTVKIVTEDMVLWRDPPDSEEAGSPNVMGAVALGFALKALQQVGMQTVAEHEHALSRKLLAGLQNIKGVEIYGPLDAGMDEKLGVVPFNIKGLHHANVAAILGCEFAVGVRSGCFCAHPYVKHLMRLSEPESEDLIDKIRRGEHVDLPGLARISLGIYSEDGDVTRVLEAIEEIGKGNYRGNYVLDAARGEYWPAGFEPNYQEYFSF
jgi:selenocysteine lyase/cysteine desulfurase